MPHPLDDFPKLPGETSWQHRARFLRAHPGRLGDLIRAEQPKSLGRRARRVRASASLRDDCSYRADLARFPNDPEAFVSGPHSLQRLVDKRKREGWVEGPPLSELMDAPRTPKPPDLAECLQRVRSGKDDVT